jgi:hypothetical protein
LISKTLDIQAWGDCRDPCDSDASSLHLLEFLASLDLERVKVHSNMQSDDKFLLVADELDFCSETESERITERLQTNFNDVTLLSNDVSEADVTF